MRTEVGVERKLHSTFVWSEKSIQLLSCELHGKERPRNTHRGSLVIMLSFYNSRECEQLPMGKVKRAKREGRFFFFIAKPIGAIQYISLPYGTGNIKYAC